MYSVAGWSFGSDPADCLWFKSWFLMHTLLSGVMGRVSLDRRTEGGRTVEVAARAARGDRSSRRLQRLHFLLRSFLSRVTSLNILGLVGSPVLYGVLGVVRGPVVTYDWMIFIYRQSLIQETQEHTQGLDKTL